MAEWNQTRDPETREIITCRGTIRCAAATAASTPFRDWAPPPPPETNNPQRPKILVAGSARQAVLVPPTKEKHSERVLR